MVSSASNPVLAPGESFEYTSGTRCPDYRLGLWSGRITWKRGAATAFSVRIPAFSLRTAPISRSGSNLTAGPGALQHGALADEPFRPTREASDAASFRLLQRPGPKSSLQTRPLRGSRPARKPWGTLFRTLLRWAGDDPHPRGAARHPRPRRALL